MSSSQQYAAELSAKTIMLIEQTMKGMYERRPELERQYGAAGKERCREDVDFHFCTLNEAIAANDRNIFLKYVEWGKIVLISRKVRVDDLVDCFLIMQEAIASNLGKRTAAKVNGFIQSALDEIESMPETMPPLIDLCNPLASSANGYLQALLSADRDEARRLVKTLRQTGTRTQDIFCYLFEPVQREVGRLWQLNQISVAQEHYCTASTELLMGELQRDAQKVERKPHFFLGTCVAGAQHSIGIRMLSELLEADGWKVYFTGANTPTSSLLDLISRFKIDVVGISAATPIDLPTVRKLISAVKQSKGRKPKVMVGGRVFNEFPGLWKKVGADSWARDAIRGAKVVNRLVNKAGSAKRRALKSV